MLPHEHGPAPSQPGGSPGSGDDRSPCRGRAWRGDDRSEDREVVVRLNVNGADVEVDDRFAASPLLWVLRDVLGMHGHEVRLRDRAVRGVHGADRRAEHQVVPDPGRDTPSGRRSPPWRARPGPVVDAVRDAWHRGNVVQCGYCQPGQTLAATALLEANQSPDDAAIDQWMNGNLCRCGTYPRIRHAIRGGRRDAGRGPRPGAAGRPPGAGDDAADAGGAGRSGPPVRPHPPGRDRRRLLEPDRDGAGGAHHAGD